MIHPFSFAVLLTNFVPA